MTSHYFNNFSPAATSENRLLEDLVNESIHIMGHSCFYLPRESFNEHDFLFGENVQSKFSKAYPLDTYLANIEGYDGDGEFFSKFGLEIRDTTSLVIASRHFTRRVPSGLRSRPQEGDLLWIPLQNMLVEIKFVEEEMLFFSIGKRDPYLYELRCERFRFSNENIDTGISEIDNVESDVSYTIELNVTGGNAISYRIGEVVYQGANLAYALASGTISNWLPDTSKIYLHNIKGEFNSNTVLIGSQSNARFTVTTTDTIKDFTDFDIYDNRLIQTEADIFIDTSEHNPIGSP